MSTSGPPPTTPDRRAPTAAEARALAHPLRIRIVFACRDVARTNKELAAELDSTPGTIHYHLKPLVTEGFLVADDPRPGPRGSVEQPYRSTGKSWQLDAGPTGNRTVREVAASDLLAATEDDMVALSRLGMTLDEADRDELVERLHALAEEFKERGTAVDGAVAPGAERLVMLVAIHRSGPRVGEDGRAPRDTEDLA